MNTSTGFRLWSVQSSTSRISVGGIIFVMSQMHENTFVVQTIHFSNGCSSWIFFFYEISHFGVDFEMCNFVDRYMPKHTHYIRTKIKKVEKHNRISLTFLEYDWLSIVVLSPLHNKRLHPPLGRMFNGFVYFRSRDFKDFLKSALDRNPETRPTAAQLLEVRNLTHTLVMCPYTEHQRCSREI